MSKKNTKQKKKDEAKEGFLILFNYAKKYKLKIYILIIFSIIIAALGAIFPLIFGKVVDSIIDLDKMVIFSSTIDTYIFFFILYAVLRAFFIFVMYVSELWSELLWNKIYVDYRINAFEKISRLPFSFHKEKKYGKWSSVVDRSSHNVSQILSNNLKRVLPEIIFLLFPLFISFSINTYLGLIILVGVSVYGLIIYLVNEKIIKLSEKVNKSYKKFHSMFFETFANIFEVKKNSTEFSEENNLKKYIVGTHLKNMNNSSRLWEKSTLARQAASSITRIAVFGVAMLLAVKGKISVGELATINAYSMRVFRPLDLISNLWTYWISSLVTIKDAESTITMKPEVYNPKGKEVFPKDFKGEIEFENVEFAYGEKEKNVLKKVNLNIEQGQKVAFVGESGVGKSTAIDLIGGFYFPQKGSVKIDGIDSKKLGLEDLRSKIAFVSQDISLFNDTVENNIKYGSKRVSSKKVIEASKKAFADDFIKDFPKKYKQKVGNRGIKLSGGQKQRISIARAILRDPKILILDEPTSSLDIKSEKYITESLDDLMKGRTTIIIAHRLSTVRNVDKIFVFKNGKVVEEGSHKELLKLNGEYKNMHDMHIGLN